MRLSEKQLIEINKYFTGHGDVLNPGLLGSAFSSYHYYEDLEVQACSILVGLVRNHAFRDGNKRTAFTAFNIVRQKMGLDLPASDDELFDTIIKIAVEKLSAEDVARRLFRRS